MEKRYSIGIDFGTLTARGVLVDVTTGDEVAVSIFGYQDAVIDRYLPGSTDPLPPEYALQNPRDYQEALEGLLKELWRNAGVEPGQVIGIGIDFTACTMLPLDENYMPLCYQPEYRHNPHAWVKLWKHHGAQAEANQINRTALTRGERFIARCGGASSSEWFFPKILETLNHAPEVYDATHRFSEAADWIVFLLTGELRKNGVTAGFKGFWNPVEGYPPPEFFAALHPKMEHVVRDKIGEEVYPAGSWSGSLTREMAQLTGLKAGTRVALGNIDAHISFPATGAREEATMLMIMGTSLCHILVSSKEVLLKGISGVVYDSVLPGFYGYEAGQAAVGDIYDWFVSKLLPHDYLQEVVSRNQNVFDLMNEKAAAVEPGASGLLALDWWNGNRSVLVDADLSGLILGLTLSTKPEEIYRALIEATAFGTRMVIEAFESQGAPVGKLYACGGLARKSPQIMQIFSDITGKEIYISGVQQTSAFGAAMYGAVAAGRQRGGYDDIYEAIGVMPKPVSRVFRPNREHFPVYSRLYEEYLKLHDYFGRGDNDVMKVLKRIRNQTLSRRGGS